MSDIVPSLDYTSRDYAGLKQSLLDFAAISFPEWVPASEGDFGVMMLELLAYVGDINSYYVDRAQLESYLPTATQRSSVLSIAQTLGYTPGTGAPAKGTVTFKGAVGAAGTGPAVTVPAGTRLSSDFSAEVDGQIIFETDATVVVPADAGEISVAVTEGETAQDAATGDPLKLGESDGLPDQTVRLTNPNVYDDTIRVFVNDEEWLKVAHLLDYDPADKVFETFQDESNFSWVRFGDNINGVIPNLGLSISAYYRSGVGASGNLAAGKITTVFESDLSGFAIKRDTSNVFVSTATTGGANPEDTEQIRLNAPRTFHSQQRAVTLADFKAFALAVPGVSRAAVVANFQTSVTIYVLGPDGAPATSGLQSTVALNLADKLLAGVTVSVGAPVLIGVNVGSIGTPVAIEVWPTFSRTQTQFLVEQAIKDLLSFTQADLGQKITVSSVYKAIMDVEGVRYVSIPLLARVDAAQSGTVDIQFQAFEFPTPGTVVVTSTGGIG